MRFPAGNTCSCSTKSLCGVLTPAYSILYRKSSTHAADVGSLDFWHAAWPAHCTYFGQQLVLAWSLLPAFGGAALQR